MLWHIEDGVMDLLRRIEALGCSVVIITNADEAWVRFSSERFLPRIALCPRPVHKEEKETTMMNDQREREKKRKKLSSTVA